MKTFPMCKQKTILHCTFLNMDPKVVDLHLKKYSEGKTPISDSCPFGSARRALMHCVCVCVSVCGV